MYRILLLGHGNIAGEMLSSAELIVGIQPVNLVKALPLLQGQAMFEYKSQIEKYVDESVKSGKCLIFVDLAGGSPFITAAEVYRKYAGKNVVDVVTGMNLTMLIETFSALDSATMEQARETAIREGHAGIQALSQALSAKASSDDANT